MRIVISSATVAAIAADARGSADEVCGLLFGTTDAVTGHRRCANVAATPRTRFEIDPAALIAAYREARAGGPRVVGHYHSHPTGDPMPSPRDAEAAAGDGALWLIAGRHGVKGWWAVEGGPVHGRFEPVDLLEV